MKMIQAMRAPASKDKPTWPPSMLMMVAAAVTWEATVPIMVKATMAASRIFAGLPKRRWKRSGMEVTSYFMPISEIFPAMPEKRNMPKR